MILCHHMEVIPILNWETETFCKPVLDVLIFATMALFPTIFLLSTPLVWVAGICFGYGFKFVLIIGVAIGGMCEPGHVAVPCISLWKVEAIFEIEKQEKELDGYGCGKDISVADSWFELPSVVHMMAMMTLMEAKSKLIPDQTVPSETVESTDDIGSAVDLLVKAAGYLQFCLREILVQIPPYMKMKLPVDLQENVLEATYIQALGQGTEMQLASSVGCKNATLSVKRRLACEQLSYFSQAPTAWGAMKHLNKKIPETAAKKSQMYAYLLEEEK
ncbi:putative BRO1 domain-containing protein BROX [Helianthus annuus]|nr:putative BRO1 domain-containing protein BROX [Helianthus annuus]KAJ0938070.1 putative BRO1 domain-containing protein BROX [Helianthus annuus]